KSVVGTARALSGAYPDPDDASGKYVAVDIAPVKRLPRPVTLAEIKADAAFKDFPLVRIARLSVMPVTDAEWARLEGMAGKARARRHPDAADQGHRFFFRVLARPLGDDRVDLRLPLDSGGAGGEARVVDQLFAPDQLHQPSPVLGIAAARGDVDPVVGAVGLALIKPGRRIGAHHGFPAASWRRFPRARLNREAGAHVVKHRVLHRHLQPPALAGSLPFEKRAEDRHRHQHAGAGVAEARAGLDGRPISLAGHADHAAGGLRDHVEGESLLVLAAGAESLDRAIDDAGVELPDLVVPEPEAVDRPRRHVLHRDVGLLEQL